MSRAAVSKVLHDTEPHPWPASVPYARYERLVGEPGYEHWKLFGGACYRLAGRAHPRFPPEVCYPMLPDPGTPCTLVMADYDGRYPYPLTNVIVDVSPDRMALTVRCVAPEDTPEQLRVAPTPMPVNRAQRRAAAAKRRKRKPRR